MVGPAAANADRGWFFSESGSELREEEKMNPDPALGKQAGAGSDAGKTTRIRILPNFDFYSSDIKVSIVENVYCIKTMVYLNCKKRSILEEFLILMLRPDRIPYLENRIKIRIRPHLKYRIRIGSKHPDPQPWCHGYLKDGFVGDSFFIWYWLNQHGHEAMLDMPLWSCFVNYGGAAMQCRPHLQSVNQLKRSKCPHGCLKIKKSLK